MASSDRQIAGVLLFVGAVQFVFGLNIAEDLYPNYSVSMNYVSDLGANCNVTCNIVQPTSTIFNSSVFILGLLVVTGTFFIVRAYRTKLFSILLFLAGMGAMGVGIFSETSLTMHWIASLIAFLFGGLSALASYKIEKTPKRYFSMLLGTLTLASLSLFISGRFLRIGNFLGLGPGGMERLIVYPVMLWAIGLGSYMMHNPETPQSGDQGAPCAVA
jgi:hypothetical membrane protein